MKTDLIQKMIDQHEHCATVLKMILKDEHKDIKDLLVTEYTNSLIDLIKMPVEGAMMHDDVPFSDMQQRFSELQNVQL